MGHNNVSNAETAAPNATPTLIREEYREGDNLVVVQRTSEGKVSRKVTVGIGQLGYEGAVQQADEALAKDWRPGANGNGNGNGHNGAHNGSADKQDGTTNSHHDTWLEIMGAKPSSNSNAEGDGEYNINFAYSGTGNTAAKPEATPADELFEAHMALHYKDQTPRPATTKKSVTRPALATDGATASDVLKEERRRYDMVTVGYLEGDHRGGDYNPATYIAQREQAAAAAAALAAKATEVAPAPEAVLPVPAASSNGNGSGRPGLLSILGRSKKAS